MSDLQFRLLRADEIDCRAAQVKANGLSLLLYKDARCDMNILDETVGVANWERHHEEIAGNLFCTVSIRFDDGWVSKQDVGTESNMEKEKGQASDAFKRACFCWGIGRELYTAPFIWIPASKCKIEQDKNRADRYYCNDKFHVGEIEYTDRKISFLTICNKKELVWSMGEPDNSPSESEQFVTKDMIASMRSEIKRVGKSERGVLDWLGVSRIEAVTIEKYKLAMDTMGAIKR